MRRGAIQVVFQLVLAMLVLSSFGVPVFAQEIEVAIGQQRTVVSKTLVLDMSITVLERDPVVYILVPGGGDTLLVRAKPDFTPIDHKVILRPSHREGAFDKDYAGIGGAVRVGNKIIAVYHSEQHDGRISKKGIPVFYATIGLAVSTDDGRTFTKKGAVISSHKSSWEKERAHMQGAAGPTLLIDHTGQYLFCYYTEHSRIDPATGKRRKGSVTGQPVITCMARSRIEDEGMPGTWKKYYRGSFSEPGLGGKDTEVADCWAPHVQYIPAIKKYIMLGSRGCIGCYQSDDATHWTFPDPERLESAILWRLADIPVFNREFAMHPCFVITRTGSNFASGIILYKYSEGIGKGRHWTERRSFMVKRID